LAQAQLSPALPRPPHCRMACHRWRDVLRFLCCAVALLIQPADAQVKVMVPANLVQNFKATGGWILGSTATFGAPFYGDRFIGRLVYGKSKTNKQHCTKEDYDVEQPKVNKGEKGAMRLLHIIVVRRGECSFTTKVRVAQEKGAHAVIIVDKEDSKLTSEDMANIIIADDGFGASIRIPSVFVSKEDGNALISALQNEEVIVELAWNLPTSHVVQVDLWMSSASSESVMFLKDFAPMRKQLNRVVAFQPHFAVFGVAGQQSTALHNQLCSDSSGQYCAEDPDGAGPITGRDVLEENVRQLCIHQVSKVPRKSVNSQKAGMEEGVMFAGHFWDYVEQFLDNCPLNGGDPVNRFGRQCSDKLMKMVGVDTTLVDRCVQENTTAYLKKEREFQAWSPRALRINGWRYSGVLDAELVTRAICSGFVQEPIECKDLTKDRDPFGEAQAVQHGNRVKELVFAIMAVTAVMGAVMMCYKGYLKQEMRASLREEVMLEVQAQIGEYQKMQGHE